ncbi:DPCD protein [Trypanosoma rangeli]|uniref:Protein DPCD n=1 Tax=Trypanosoma rangeli TaxID=5698 RepID=A0A3R7N9M0_TRYRA|nr:DPCD protein [Trypanosoma rangeli]RNF02805.1 DPCD protein [Trypanosoma rangeli]|eukprot:RNF02805.1 DPCD protein [Trypanosoma rangeli]
MSDTLAEPKTSVIVNERKRITSKFVDGSEMVEEFDVITDDLLLRKRRVKTALGNFGDWQVEVGNELRVRSLEKELLVEANGSPELVRQDTPEYHVFRIRNLPYAREVFSVAVEHREPGDAGEIVVRTSNKKYFKRLTILDLQRRHIQLDPTHLSYEVQHNTLIVRYKKPLAILVADAAAKKERAALPARRIDGAEGAGGGGCAQQ